MKILRSYPQEMEIHGQNYHYEKILKDDFFSVNVLYKNADDDRYVLKLSDFRFLFGLLFRPFAIWMSRREYKVYEMVDGISGVPKLGPRLGLRGYFHHYIEGKTLREWTRGEPLRDDFFDRLRTILDEVHALRIFYMDLDKQGNVIVGDDGMPYLIDYQICIRFRPFTGFLGDWRKRWFERFREEDIYHVYKHKKRFQPERITEEELALAQRSQLTQRYNRFFGTPYRKVKRLIYPSGSNDIIWYKWNKNKGKQE